MRKILAAAAVLLNAHIIFVVLLHLLFLAQQYLPKAVSLWFGLHVYLVNLFPFYLLLSVKKIFISWLILVPVLTIFMLLKRGRPMILFLLGLLAYGYFLFGLSHYQPAIEFIEGTQWFWVDKPKGVVELMFQTILAQSEGRNRHYEIVGWQDNETLIFKKASRRKEEIFAYRWGGEQELINSLPEEIFSQFCEFNNCVKPTIKDIWYAGSRKIFVSPDGGKLAFITEHLYGPQDIIVVEKK